MLIGISPLLGPDLLHALRSMGHGDEIALVDGNYPAVEHARRLIRADGMPLVPLLRAILRDATYRAGDYDTMYLAGLLRRLDHAALLAETAADAAVAASVPDRARLAIPGSDELRVLSAQAGIFYRAPSPGEPDLVQEGEIIARDRAFGLLEVMKTFTPMTLAAPGGGTENCYPAAAYRVVSVGAVSGQQVNPGDLLMIVRPDV